MTDGGVDYNDTGDRKHGSLVGRRNYTFQGLPKQNSARTESRYSSAGVLEVCKEHNVRFVLRVSVLLYAPLEARQRFVDGSCIDDSQSFRSSIWPILVPALKATS